MPNFQNHICFVSGQNIPEVIGALTPDCGGAHIHAIISPSMAKTGKYFENTCVKLGFNFSPYILPSPDRYETRKLLDVIFYSHPNETFAVNITGGTKLMSLAAYDWCGINGIPSLYVDTSTVQIHMRENGIWKIIPIPDMLNLDALLHLYGHQITTRKNERLQEKIRSALKHIIAFLDMPDAENAICALNNLAISAAATSNFTIAIPPDFPNMDPVLSICQNFGLLKYARRTVRFHGRDACQWCNGIWLENYIQMVLDGLHADKKINSYACAVKTSCDGVSNELDGVFTAKNQLFVIECKAGSMKKSSSLVPQILYKADSLRERLGGIFTKFMICTIDQFSTKQKERAALMNIKLVEGSKLKNLRQIILDWI